jgi:hypothetical protein
VLGGLEEAAELDPLAVEAWATAAAFLGLGRGLSRIAIAHRMRATSRPFGKSGPDRHASPEADADDRGDPPHQEVNGNHAE